MELNSAIRYFVNRFAGMCQEFFDGEGKEWGEGLGFPPSPQWLWRVGLGSGFKVQGSEFKIQPTFVALCLKNVAFS